MTGFSERCAKLVATCEEPSMINILRGNFTSDRRRKDTKTLCHTIFQPHQYSKWVTPEYKFRACPLQSYASREM
jgi:hypothetical protein